MWNAFEHMLKQWNTMQNTGILEGSEDAATLFEHTFYQFMDEFKSWFSQLNKKPATLEEALALPDVKTIVEQLPSPLYLPFETELDFIVDGIDAESDEKYD